MVTTPARWTSGLSVSTRRGPTGAQPARALWGCLMLLRGVWACHLGDCGVSARHCQVTEPRTSSRTSG